MRKKHQTTREGPDKYTDTKPSVIKKELAEGQLYQMQEKQQTTKEGPDKYTDTKPSVASSTKCKRSIRPQGKAQTSTQTPSQV